MTTLLLAMLLIADGGRGNVNGNVVNGMGFSVNVIHGMVAVGYVMAKSLMVML